MKGSGFEGWNDSAAPPGKVRRFSKSAWKWVTVEKSRFYERWGYEHLKARGDDP